jgi:hypothetical protein
LLLGVLIVGWLSEFAYRSNNICGPGDHIIQSDADAIKMAQSRLFRARYGCHGIAGYVDEMPDHVDFSHVENCCEATRSRTVFGVIVWQVYLSGETIGEPKKRRVGVSMKLSNCCVVFHDSFITADP